jgi:glycosyltransferase involved in cell wall biosynthesis
MQKVVGIIMTYNCASMVEGTYRRLDKTIFDEIILVDDGSSDDIQAVATRMGIPFFPHPHTGYGGNIKYGLQRALELGADIMVEIHGDGQFDPTIAKVGIDKMKEGYDFVMGSRFTNLRQPLQDGMSWARYLANIGLSFFDRLSLRIPLTEYHGGFRVYSRRLLETVGFAHTSNDYLYSFEIIAQAAYYRLPVSEIPMRANYHGEHTSISLRKAAVYSLQTFGVLFKFLLARLGLRTKLFSGSVAPKV